MDETLCNGAWIGALVLCLEISHLARVERQIAPIETSPRALWTFLWYQSKDSIEVPTERSSQEDQQ